MSLPKKAYLIKLNGKIVCAIFSSGAYALMIMDDMREEHFEEIFGVELSKKASGLEAEYEKEYSWECDEVDYLTTADAELRCDKIRKRATESC